MSDLSKLQIRAKVLAAVSEIKSEELLNNSLLDKITVDLQSINDRNALFDILIKEYVKMSENEYMFTGCLIKNLADAAYVQEKVFDTFKSTAFSDEVKYKMLQLLRIIDSKSAFDVIPQYFENPEEVLDLETEKLLNNAVINPESMLDFLDFIYTVQEKDKLLLLQSLKEDYKDDALANIVYPILYSDFPDNIKLLTVDILSESKSSIAIKPVKHLLNITENTKIKQACTIALKKLQLSGADEIKAKEYFRNITKNSHPAHCYATIPDGAGNQALLFSRVNNQNQFTFAAFVINDLYGIVDCFGFYQISDSEFSKIASKFFKSEGKFSVPPDYIKYKLKTAFEFSCSHKRNIPYEFICWSVLLNDVEENNFEDLNNSGEKINNNDLINLLTKKYTFRWYIDSKDNTDLNEFMEYIYNQKTFDIEAINNKLRNTTNQIFDEMQEKIWFNRLKNLAYLLINNDNADDGKNFLKILNSDETKNLFKQIIIQRSIFNNFVRLLNEGKIPAAINIFTKKEREEKKYNAQKLDDIISKLQESWTNG